jgi:hypothetical protein
MKNRECDLCTDIIRNPGCGESPLIGVSFEKYDLCEACVSLVRRAICKRCHGTGKVRKRDDEATSAQATCGENRTQYKMATCKDCKQ